jgi:hypothetical protein
MKSRQFPQSEALECVQLAAAFLPASLLAPNVAPGLSPACADLKVGATCGISTATSLSRGLLSVPAGFPASKLAGEKAAASCRTPKPVAQSLCISDSAVLYLINIRMSLMPDWWA